MHSPKPPEFKNHEFGPGLGKHKTSRMRGGEAVEDAFVINTLLNLQKRAHPSGHLMEALLDTQEAMTAWEKHEKYRAFLLEIRHSIEILNDNRQAFATRGGEMPELIEAVLTKWQTDAGQPLRQKLDAPAATLLAGQSRPA